ncbi:MAG: hypothetical protein GY906_07925 [bacterium]|nr:hypothetical protein [bacterium]
MNRQLEQLRITRTQRQLISDMGEVLGGALDMPVMRGFYAQAVISWQQQINMTAAETETKVGATKSARVKTAVEILAILREKVLPVVRVHKKEHLLDGAIAEALEFYTTRYADRPPDTR